MKSKFILSLVLILCTQWASAADNSNHAPIDLRLLVASYNLVSGGSRDVEHAMKASVFAGYVSALWEGFLLDESVCQSESSGIATLGELMSIVAKHVDDNPNYGTASGIPLVYDVFLKHYPPC